MPFTFLQNKSAYNGNTTTQLVTNSALQANSFLVVFVQSGTLGNPSISSSPSTTWQQILSVQDELGSKASIRVWRAMSPSASVMTINITNAAPDTGIDLWEFGTDGIVPALDDTPLIRTQSADGTLRPYSLNVRRNGNLLFSSLSDENEVTASGSLAGADYTLFQTQHSSASAVIVNAGAAGGKSINWSWSGSQSQYAMCAFSFYLPPYPIRMRPATSITAQPAAVAGTGAVA